MRGFLWPSMQDADEPALRLDYSQAAPFIRYLLIVVRACNGGNSGCLEASGNGFGKLARGCVATDVGCSYGVR